MPPNTPASESYEPVESVRNSDGLVAVITRRKFNNAYTVAVYKEFERNGQTEKTPYLHRRQIDGAIELLKIAGEKIDARIAAAAAEPK